MAQVVGVGVPAEVVAVGMADVEVGTAVVVGEGPTIVAVGEGAAIVAVVVGTLLVAVCVAVVAGVAVPNGGGTMWLHPMSLRSSRVKPEQLEPGLTSCTTIEK